MRYWCRVLKLCKRKKSGGGMGSITINEKQKNLSCSGYLTKLLEFLVFFMIVMYYDYDYDLIKT